MKRELFRMGLVSLLFLLSCGEKDGELVTIQFTGTAWQSAQSNVTLIDYYFVLQNVGEPVLDSDGDLVPDVFLIPTTCPTSLPAGCGYPFEVSSQTLGNVPFGYSYDLTARFRNQSGTVLYSGKTTFLNTNVEQTISVPVIEGNQ